MRGGDTRYGNGNGFIYGGICVDTYVCVCVFAVIEDDFQVTFPCSALMRIIVSVYKLAG